jgi:hypothetical protein
MAKPHNRVHDNKELKDDSQGGILSEGEGKLTEGVTVPAPPAARYQLAAGSPRHSPTVTPL